MSKDSQMENARHELLQDVADQVAIILREHGIDAELREQAGLAVADHLADHWAGQLIYYPKDHVGRLSARDLRIYNEFTGHNHGALAKKHNMSVDGIYKLLRRARRKDLDRRQCKLELLDFSLAPSNLSPSNEQAGSPD